MARGIPLAGRHLLESIQCSVWRKDGPVAEICSHGASLLQRAPEFLHERKYSVKGCEEMTQDSPAATEPRHLTILVVTAEQGSSECLSREGASDYILAYFHVKLIKTTQKIF